MNVDRALHLTTAALAVIGALFLGLGHQSVVLPSVLAIAAASSVWLSTRLKWLRLNRLLANVIALAAVIWALRNFLQVGSEGQLLAIADMLVYLQVVLFFQEKTARVYWQLIVLSLLQVVVAAALNLGPEFGLLLAVYMSLALLALVLLCRYHEWQKLAFSNVARPASTVTDEANWRSLLGEPAARQPSEAAAAIAKPSPAPLTRHTALLAAATFSFALVFFYATPRLRDGAWTDHRDGSTTSTGYALEAVLEDSGRIHQSNQLVMRVVLTSALDRRSYSLASEPYFHGLALAEYVAGGERGRWIAGHPPRISRQLPMSPPNVAPLPLANLVRQDIMLEGGAPQPFAIYPVHNVQETASGIQVLPQTGRLPRPSQSAETRTVREFRYTIATSGLRNGRHLRAYPHRNRMITANDGLHLVEENKVLTRFDRQRFAGLAAVADRVVKESGSEALGSFEQALALERHFHVTGLYRYSLNLNFKRDKRLDPIEDFVVNHRTGHCEYFASALVMMLRSRGIPARMVIGYKGGDYNPIGDYYQVRQKHSHAWVEVHLTRDETPKWELAGTPSDGGAWYRLDPTPTSFQMEVAEIDEGPLSSVVQTFDYVELLWRDYVLSLNADKQHDSIYDPVGNRTLAWLPGWMEARSADRLVRRMAYRLGLAGMIAGPDEVPAGRVFHWRSGSMVVLALILGVVGLQALHQCLAWLRFQWEPGRRALRRRASVPPRFYRRLESLLARAGLRRSDGQTAHEMAALAADRLSRSGQPNTITEVPRAIVAAYYRVRFGSAKLESGELAAIERALDQLSPAVEQARA